MGRRMILRNGLIVLVILALTAAYLPASAETYDFPFLPGLTWNSTLEKLELATGTFSEDDSQAIGSSGRIFQLTPKNAGLAPCRYVITTALSATNELSMLIFIYDMSSFLTDKTSVRRQITEEMEKLYGGRGEVLFDTPENMKLAFANIPNEENVYKSSILGGYEGCIKDMFENLDDVAAAKGWLVDQKFGAMMIYGTEGKMSNMVSVVLINADQTLSMFSSTGSGENRTGCFELPEGTGWLCDAATLTAALDKAGVLYAENDGDYQALHTNGPNGNAMLATYIFDNGAMVGVIYSVEMSFDDLEAVMIQEFGEKAPIDTQMLTQQLQNSFGVAATRLSFWLSSDTLYYLFESPQGVFIWCVGKETLTQ